jgi:nucleoside 2-deoxyribosyltransferase
MTKIYFAGSIRGGREDASLYREIITLLQTRGEVLTEHIGSEGLTPSGETAMSDEEIYRRDMDWLTSSDIIVAEVTTPSLGVGFEIAKALDLGKQVICLFRPGNGRRLSAMIAGNTDVKIYDYQSMQELVKLFNDTAFVLKI